MWEDCLSSFFSLDHPCPSPPLSNRPTQGTSLPQYYLALNFVLQMLAVVEPQKIFKPISPSAKWALSRPAVKNTQEEQGGRMGCQLRVMVRGLSLFLPLST